MLYYKNEKKLWIIFDKNKTSLNDHIDVIKYLIEECHVKVEAKNKNGETPFLTASYNGDIEIIKYLIEQCHANYEAKDKTGWNV